MQVTLPLQRVGTNGDVTVHWVLRGSGPNRDHVTELDVTPMSGIVAMTSGVTLIQLQAVLSTTPLSSFSCIYG